MFSSMLSSSSAASPSRVMELHPLSSKPFRDVDVDDEERGVFSPKADELEAEENEEEISTRYHRVDSIDEFGGERIGLMNPTPTSQINGKPLMPDNNLDVFFKEMYEYYMKKGFGSIISTAITNLTSIAFTIWVTMFFMTMFDWDKLAECRSDERVCASFANYIHSPFANGTFFTSSVLMGSILASFGWVWMLWGLVFTVTSAVRYRNIYRVNGIVTRDLQTMSWSTVVTKLRDWQKQVFYVKNEMQVSAFTIALRIMRKENFKIAFFCLNILPLGSPDWPTTFAWVPYTAKFKDRQFRKPKQTRFQDTEFWWMGNVLEQNLDFAIFNHMIDDKSFTLRKDLTPRHLRMHFKVLAVINLALLPLTFMGTFLFFFFRYAEELHSKRNYLGPRWWTPHALWILREFNELPHVYQKRLNGSLRLSEKYLRMFPSPVPIVLARGAAFILGGLVAILLVFALVDDAVLLHVSLWDRNLVWYAAILSSALAAARALIPPPEEESPGNPNVQMRRIAAYTHLLPDHWRGKANTYDVKEQFEALFPFRVNLLLRELLCCIFTPYILWRVLPEYSEDILQFFKDYSSSHVGVGDVCTFSLMNLEKDHDPKWNKLLKAIPFSAAGEEEEEFDQPLNRNGANRKRKMDALVESKLEKSWITFKIQYSADNCGIRDSFGEDLLRRVKDFQQSKRPFQQEQANEAAMLMSSSLSTFDNLQLLPVTSTIDEEDHQDSAGEDIFWYLEQFRDEEMRKRTMNV